MATATLREFLESSTIHGLEHISTAKSRGARAAWVAIVVACFATAIYMITNSYKEWQESPVSTTITTHPITELDFPSVTVCPPRRSNTALNHLLKKVKDVNFTDEERRKLLNISKEVFIEIPSKKYAREVRELLTTENMRSIANGQTDIVGVDKQGMITIRSSEPQGSFRTPGFGDSKYEGAFFNRPHSLHYVLDLEHIREFVGEGSLVLNIHAQGNWSYSFQEQQLQLYQQNLSMSDAESYCADRGGHLPSIMSLEEQERVSDAANGTVVWLGAKKKTTGSGWEWTDGRPWGFENWSFDGPQNCLNCTCALDYSRNGFAWYDTVCDNPFNRNYPFVCAVPPRMMSGNQTLTLDKASLVSPILHFWWSPELGSKCDTSQGIEISWSIKNGSTPNLDEQRNNRTLGGQV